MYIRELLQNGVDAITARRLYCEEAGLDVSASWGVTIYPATGAYRQLVVTDDGIGLSADEVTDLLATVGRSSKRDILDMARTDYLGQFGIGLLSCFMVSDQIRIVSQSASGSRPVEWVGSGEGTFEVRELDQVLPVGTQVFLTGAFDRADLLTAATVTSLATGYGQFLPVPVTIAERAEVALGASTGPVPGATGLRSTINCPPVFAETDHQRLVDYCSTELGFEPLDIIDLAAPGTGTTGKGFVLPFSPPP
ncbi:MAG: ATP-binding protein, partial [Micrococcales bacterium]|nr:ATP-binding protein [Micrococcales bacterium]